MRPLQRELLQLLERLDDYQVRLVISFVKALFN
jgi:hypothetical protein